MRLRWWFTQGRAGHGLCFEGRQPAADIPPQRCNASIYEVAAMICLQSWWTLHCGRQPVADTSHDSNGSSAMRQRQHICLQW